MSDTEHNFEPFTQKGGKLVTKRTASVSMNNHGNINVPASVQSQLFDDADYVRFHADHNKELIALEAFDEDDAPPNAYKLSGDGSASAPVESVLQWIGKRPPEGHTMFELQYDGEMPYIDVSELPDWSESDD